MTASPNVTLCWHCGGPLTRTLTVRLPDGLKPVCCNGCAAAAQTIHGLGLGDYYRFRPNPTGEIPNLDEADLVVFSLPELVAPFLVSEGGRNELTLLVDGIHCAACIWLIEKALKALPGVTRVSLAMSSGQLRISWQGDKTSPSSIARRLVALGYRPRLPGTTAAVDNRAQRWLLARLLVAGIGAMQAMMYATALYLGAFDGVDEVYQSFFRIAGLLVATPVVFFSGWPFLHSAIRALRIGSVNMEVPVALALSLGWAGSVWATATGGAHVYFESIAMFVFFLLLSRWLEQRQRQRVTDLFSRLQTDMPLVVTRVGAAGDEQVPLRRVAAGDRLRLRQGDVVPVDGQVVEGNALVQEAALTGEAIPLVRAQADAVVAGSRLQEGWLLIESRGRAEDSRLARIGALVERAQSRRYQPYSGLQQVAGGFVLAVLALASLTLAWHWSAGPALAFEYALAVLVVTCPCALALAAPLTLAAMIGKGLEQDVLVADPARFLALPRVTSAVFDKTGTLTQGAFRVTRIDLLAPALSQRELLRVVAGLESHASHPLALPLRGLEDPAPVTDVHLTRAGVEGNYDGHHWRIGAAPTDIGTTSPGTRLLLLRDDLPVLELELCDQPRPEAAAVLAALHEHGLLLQLASGDQPGPVAALALGLSLDGWHAALSPEEKGQIVTALQGRERVLVVGDGVNDAPAFMAADVSVAVADSSALARDAAAVYLLRPGLASLPWLFLLARRARRVLRQNLAWAAGYNLIAVPFAMAGLVPPWLAAIGMSLSSLLVTGNAARLAKWKS